MDPLRDPIRALYELFRLGARITDIRAKIFRAVHKSVVAATLGGAAFVLGTIGVCFLLVAADQVLARYLGEVGAPLLLAALLLLLAAIALFRATSLIKAVPPPPAVPAQPQEMSNAALLALLGGIVVGTVLQSRASKE